VPFICEAPRQRRAAPSNHSPPPPLPFFPNLSAAGCFAVGAADGFRIYSCDPYTETFRRNFSTGGIGMVEMLFRCNILALVGGGQSPRWPKHKVMVWDDHQNRCIGELSFRSEVKAVRLRRDRVVVALLNKVYVYNFADLTLADHLETAENPRGLCAVCPSPTANVLACPGPSKGQVRIELYDQRRRQTIAAHEAALACLALNAAGTRLATASEKGTLIRVWDTATGELLQELRRGADSANICCIAFNAATTLLACASDKGTVHVFKLSAPVSEGGAGGGGGGGAGGAAGGEGAAAASAAAPAAAGAAAGAAAAAAAAAAGSPAAGAGSGASARGARGAGAEEAPPRGGGGGGAGGGAGGGSSGAGGGGGGGEHDAEAPQGASAFGLFKGVQRMLPKYFSSEWSFAQFRVPPLLSICAFSSEPNTIMGACARAPARAPPRARAASNAPFPLPPHSLPSFPSGLRGRLLSQGQH
jgi:hypothetical protein